MGEKDKNNIKCIKELKTDRITQCMFIIVQPGGWAGPAAGSNTREAQSGGKYARRVDEREMYGQPGRRGLQASKKSERGPTESRLGSPRIENPARKDWMYEEKASRRGGIKIQ